MKTGAPARSSFDWDRALRHLQVLAAIWFPRRLKGRLDPEDLAQDAVCKAFEKIEQFRGSTTGEFLAWLRQILLNTVRNHMRDHPDAGSMEGVGQKTERKLEDLIRSLSTSILSRITRDELLLLVLDEMAKLPPNQLRALALQVFHEMSYAEIARELECGTASVVGLLRRARATLRERLGESLQR